MPFQEFPDLVDLIASEPVIMPYLLFYFLVFGLALIFVFFGVNFLVQGLREKENLAQRSYQVGLGLFIISVAICESSYVFDLATRFFFNQRVFRTDADYPFASLINRDYYLLIFTTLLVSAPFLLYPIEKHMLKRRPTLTIVSAAMSPTPLIVRFAEGLVAQSTPIESGSLPYAAFAIVWGFIILVIALGVLIVIVLYMKMGAAAPPGSKLKRKCIEVVVGFLAWVGAIFSTSSAYTAINPASGAPFTMVNWFYVFLVPGMLFLALILLVSGFRRDY
ncbi:MAG: hypothetical protein ACTSU5_14500 [Promethearchaeota archaeon]